MNVRDRSQRTPRLDLLSLLSTATQSPSPTMIETAIGIQVTLPITTAVPITVRQHDEEQLAPDFSLQTLTGETLQLSSFQDQPIVVNFWASWCAPCRLEMPELIRIFETYQEDGIVILGVNMTYQDDISAVQEFVDEFDIPFAVLLDETGIVTDDKYSVLGVPMTFFIRSDGTIADQYIGAMSGEQLDSFIEGLLSDSVR